MSPRQVTASAESRIPGEVAETGTQGWGSTKDLGSQWRVYANAGHSTEAQAQTGCRVHGKDLVQGIGSTEKGRRGWGLQLGAGGAELSV